MLDGEIISDITTLLGHWHKTASESDRGGSPRGEGIDSSGGWQRPQRLTYCFALYGPRGSGKTHTLKEVHRAMSSVYSVDTKWATFSSLCNGQVREWWQSPSRETISNGDDRQSPMTSESLTMSTGSHRTAVLFLDDLPAWSQLLSGANPQEFAKFRRMFAPPSDSDDVTSLYPEVVTKIVVFSAATRMGVPQWWRALFPAPVEKTLSHLASQKQCVRYLKTLSGGSHSQENIQHVAAESLRSRGSATLRELQVACALIPHDSSSHVSSGERASLAVQFLRRRSAGGLQQQVPLLYGYSELRERLSLLVRLHAITRSSGQHEDDVSHLQGPVAAAVPPTTGILLHGPSGCGKSAMVREVSQRLPHVPFLFVSGTRLFSKYLGESEAKLREAFCEARSCQPSVLVIDDIDTIAVARAEGSTSSTPSGGKGLDVTVRMLSALLCEMDGIEDTRGVLVVGTTNRLKAIDKALLRQGRMETLIEVPIPKREDTTAIVDAYLARWAASPEGEKGQPDAQLKTRLVDWCLGRTPSSIALLFRILLEGTLRIRESEKGSGLAPTASIPSITAELLAQSIAQVETMLKAA